MDQPIYTVKNLTYKHLQETILNIKNFDFHRGACYMIHGDMASGKSLFLDILSKNNFRYKGEVRYEDNNIRKLYSNKYKSQIQYIKQNTKKPFFGSVYNYINRHVKKNNQPNKINKLTDNIITVMDLKYLKNKKTRTLTPGQFRWVDLAAKIASFPKVLFIDEIEQHLSNNKINILNKILYRKCNYDGITIIATTQHKDLFSTLTSVNINVSHGRITSVRSFNKRKKRYH